MKLPRIEEGQRKMIATVITMVAGIVADKYLGGLSENLALLLGASLAMFVGGNAMEYVAKIKGSPLRLPQKEVDIGVNSELPTEELFESPTVSTNAVMGQIDKLHEYAKQIDDVCGQHFNKIYGDLKGVQKSIELQDQNIKNLVEIINGKRKVNGPAKPEERFVVPKQEFPAE